MTTPQDSLLASLQPLLRQEVGPVYAWDPVNEPMIRQWCEVMGVDNPVYLDDEAAKASIHGGRVAPPTMLQVWVLNGLNNKAPAGSSTEDPYLVLTRIEEAGFPAVVAVNSEQEYFRYLRPGDKLYRTSQMEEVAGPKTTALGEGYFVTELIKFYDEQHTLVGTMRFRLFKYRPHVKPEAQPEPTAALQKPKRPRPGISPDTAFFWDGLKERKLLIQRCKGCGALRHPPGPACPSCHSMEWDTVNASGRATLYSYVVFHYPEVPPFNYPNPIGLIELEEGTRLVAGLVGVEPEQVAIGSPLQLEFIEDDDLVLPVFRPL